ncbi:N-acetylmuramidase domain-containing protein [Microvirga subterranea]|uniref:Uncharacterized protein DUF3380 n=1 Tax=Microvirga subterranea TaxID=186651 RepID=A0A370HBM6_9HYPH|nr:N-acetylmuramidase domain-containing protein [Microvirga subterranea]RDI53623.1 uncharacterized protein DUF3380 [Microvirga subterranea]
MHHLFKGEGLPLSQGAFDEVAETLATDAAKLWAVIEIEAMRCGFLEDKRPVILFERHIFHRYTKSRFDSDYPDLSNSIPGGYGKGGASQYSRLERAVALDREAALRSTSWGLGQVMGFNAEIAGFASASEMVRDMCQSEDAQLRGMMNFILHNGLHKPLRVGNWTSFAAGYNGPKHYINDYAGRLRGAFNKYSTGPMPDLRIRAAQLYLTYHGYDPGLIDGWLGPRTIRALNDFRASVGRKEADELTHEDLEQLMTLSR